MLITDLAQFLSVPSTRWLHVSKDSSFNLRDTLASLAVYMKSVTHIPVTEY